MSAIDGKAILDGIISLIAEIEDVGSSSCVQDVMRHHEDTSKSVNDFTNYLKENNYEIRYYNPETDQGVLLGIVVSDIHAPTCSNCMDIKTNVNNLFASYQSNFHSALFCEAEYLNKLFALEKLIKTVNYERSAIDEFLKKNGLTENFKEFCRSQENI